MIFTDTQIDTCCENGIADEISKRDMIQRIARITFVVTRIRAGSDGKWLRLLIC